VIPEIDIWRVVARLGRLPEGERALGIVGETAHFAYTAVEMRLPVAPSCLTPGYGVSRRCGPAPQISRAPCALPAIGKRSLAMPHREQPEDADGTDEIAYRTQALRSQASLASASAIVCHCMFDGSSGPPQASGIMWSRQ
jgi:hypothetical protein